MRRDVPIYANDTEKLLGNHRILGRPVDWEVSPPYRLPTPALLSSDYVRLFRNVPTLHRGIHVRSNAHTQYLHLHRHSPGVRNTCTRCHARTHATRRPAHPCPSMSEVSCNCVFETHPRVHRKSSFLCDRGEPHGTAESKNTNDTGDGGRKARVKTESVDTAFFPTLA